MTEGPVRKLIPVRLGPANLQSPLALRPPLVDVGLAADAEWNPEKSGWPVHNGRIYPALLDTGTDTSAIDQAVATEIGAKPTGEVGTVRGWVGDVKHVERPIVQVLLRSIGQVCERRLGLMDFRGAGQPWDLILGRDFLRRCRFVMDGPAGRYELEWIGAPAAIHKQTG